MLLTRRDFVAAFAVLTGGARPVWAHSSYRLIGTISKVMPNRIELKQAKDERAVSVDINAQTRVSREQKPVGVAALRVGQTVAVDATGDSLQFLVATEIRIVPSPAKK